MYKIKSMFVRLISSILVIIILQTSLSTLVYATENLVDNNEIQSKKVESDDKNLNLTNKENDIGKKTENFKIILQWEKISDSEFIWKAKKGEEKTVKLILTYKNDYLEKTYLPEELQIIIPGIGKLNKMSTQKASTIFADEFGTKELKNDWSYKYNLESDTYIFYNNKEVEKGSIFNGKIELIWDFSAKDCIDNYSQSVQASLKNEENTILSPELKMTYIYQGNTETSEKVDFTKEDINQVKKQLNATNDEQTVQEDEAKTGNIVLIKEDKIDGSKLKGIEYGLYVDKDVYDEKGEIKYKKDQLIKKAVTNELGQVTFENVPIGEYYLKEIATTYVLMII